MKNRTTLLAAAILVTSLSMQSHAQSRFNRFLEMEPAQNKPALEFTLKNLEGKTVALKDIINRKKPIILEFGSYS